MTARERFEEAGWDYVGGDNLLMTYCLYEKNLTVQFYHDTKTYMITKHLQNGLEVAHDADMKTFKLITYQLEELGWL